MSEPIIKKVFSNGMKLIVVGELPASWKVVLKADGTPGYSIGNKFGRPYGMKVDGYRISYNIYAADRILGKPDANDSETRKFVEEKLVPEILKKL